MMVPKKVFAPVVVLFASSFRVFAAGVFWVQDTIGLRFVILFRALI